MCAEITFAQRGGRSSKSKSGFGVATILQSIDANKNGKLDPSEMSERTRDIVRKAGLNPNQSHAIRTIAQKLENENAKSKAEREKANKKKAGGSARKVPGFGADVEKLGVPDFSPTGEERMSMEAMRTKFGKSVMSQVDRTMGRYDKDKNGLLDPSEQNRTRWTNPSADQSDTNKDGNLSTLELAYRYKKREDDALKKASNARAASRNAAANRQLTNNRNKSSSRSTASRSSSSSRGRSSYKKPTSTASNSSKKPFNSGSDAYKRYAEGLLKNYDKNKDSKLSKKELAEMRRPPENADSNGDGYVDKNELIASVSKRSTKNSSVSKSSSSSRDKNESMSRLRRDSKKSYNSRDSVFGGKDKNNDGQLQMHEFEQNWTKEKIAKFKEKDLNGDGVITEVEWKS